MTKTEKTWVWIGGLVLGVGAVGGIAYAATHKPAPAQVGPTQPPALQPPSVQTSTTWDTGKTYWFAATVPSGVHAADTLIAALAANGWSNVQVYYFGPTGSMVPGVKLPFTVDTNMYAASGTWTGADKTPIPAGVSSVGP